MPIAAFRYNNPFDVSLPIAGYKGPGEVAGIQGQAGYGSFPDMATGYGAGVQRLNSYITGQSSHGPKSTIGELNTVYATDPNWQNGVAKYSGLAADEKLDPNNADQMKRLQYGVLAQEIGPDNATKVMAANGGAPLSFAGPPAPAGGPSTPAAPTDTPAPQAPQQGGWAAPSPTISPQQIAQMAAVPAAPNILNPLPNPFGLTRAPFSFARG